MAAGEKDKPRAIGRYVLFQEVAHGGMATVHLGRLRGPAGFARTVAIKRLHPPFARDPEFVSMFLDEARLAARIRHPNVVSVLDVVAAEGELFLVMDYIHGESFGHLINVAGKKRIAMSRRVLSTIMVGVLSGLEAAHEARNERGVPLEIVHRDVSPQNVLLGLEGVPMVLDFGVAKASLRVHWSAQSGQVKGKLAYMSPEQLTTGQVDRRADVYSAGVILWEGLTGQRMFDPKTASDVGAIVGKILTGNIAAPSTIVPSTPKALDEIVMKALSRAPEDRFKTARDMAIALENALPIVANRNVGDWVAQVAGEALLARAVDVNDIERVELPVRPSTSDFPSVRASLRPESPELAALVPRSTPMRRTGSDSGGDSVLPVPRGSEPDDDEEDERSEATLLSEAPSAGTERDALDLEHSPLSLPSATVEAALPSPAEARRALHSDMTLEEHDDSTLQAPVPDSPAAPSDAARVASPRRAVRVAAIACAAVLVGAVWVVETRLSAGSGVPTAESATASLPAPSTSSASSPQPAESSATPEAWELPATVSPPPGESADKGASAPGAPAAPHVTRPRATPRPPPSPSKPNCNPPFSTDSQGVRIPKRECFH